MIQIITFSKGTSYQSTARNIDEKLKGVGATESDILEIDYRENLIFLKGGSEDAEDN